MSDFLSSPVVMNGAVGILLLCWAFNLVFTSVTNVRREKENARAPISRIESDITDLRTELDVLKRRVDEHDDDVSDLHAGQSAMCRGVQALLEHELHNGNEDEMKAASEGIGKWLRNR